jgi:outer membrane protein assembly factor BamB
VSCGGSSNIVTVPPPATIPSVTTYHNDNARTGQNLNETTLTPANVNSSTFGLLFVIPADGVVHAQPLYLPNLTIGQGTHNVLFVATENASVYAFDADTGKQLWQVSTLGAGESGSDDAACSALGQIGITSTPVIDTKAGPNGTI